MPLANNKYHINYHTEHYNLHDKQSQINLEKFKTTTLLSLLTVKNQSRERQTVGGTGYNQISICSNRHQEEGFIILPTTIHILYLSK